MKYNYNEYAVMLKALGDETRLRITMMLLHNKTCACEILEAFNFSQPTLSYHMKQLVCSRVVSAEKIGKWVYYSINDEKIEMLKSFFIKIKDEINKKES